MAILLKNGKQLANGMVYARADYVVNGNGERIITITHRSSNLYGSFNTYEYILTKTEFDILSEVFNKANTDNAPLQKA